MSCFTQDRVHHAVLREPEYNRDRNLRQIKWADIGSVHAQFKGASRGGYGDPTHGHAGQNERG